MSECARDSRPSVLMAVSGGIAAYKACEVLRGLQRAGADVRVVMTEDARRFVGPATFEALSGHPVPPDLYHDPESAIPHIALSAGADLALVVPATANVIAKMACGIADDLLSTTLLACACPVLVAPAMNTRMWANPATQANVRTLVERRVDFVLPESGRLACGDEGAGKLAAVDDIMAAALAALDGTREGQGGTGTCADTGDGGACVGTTDVTVAMPGDAPIASPTAGRDDLTSPDQAPDQAPDLAGCVLVVTAGPTHEAIDPVRFIANASTGKMGYAIASEAARRGAEVTIVSGPVSLGAPPGCAVVRVTSALEMHTAAHEAFEAADAAICTAAVADFRPAAPATRKLKKGADRLDSIALVENPDILADLSACRGRRVVIGFAAETDDLIDNARAKLARKGCDLIVANDVSRADSTFGSDTSRVAFVSASGVEQLETLPLGAVAREVCDRLARLLAARVGR